MQVVVDRKWKKENYTIGRLSIDGKYFCDTLEDKDRGLQQTMALAEIKRRKIAAITAIPSGTYKVDMAVVSPKYSAKAWYVSHCNGARLPRLQDVPGFAGVLIHPGTTAADSEGCILVGKNTQKGMVTASKETFLKLYERLVAADKRKEKIIIVIK